jgi:hypothetical protein
MRSLSELPMPCPELALVRKRTGNPEFDDACSAAANFRECSGLTRPSVAPVSMRTAG